MARQSSRPVRRLVLFGLAVVVLFAGLAIGGLTAKDGAASIWQPKLGLDLQGGTMITLQATTSTGEAITPEKMSEARDIINQRVNGTGVAEAEVATQGRNNIVVQIPGKNRKDLVDTVKQTAQLRFRLVAAAAPGQAQPKASTGPSASPSGSASPSASPSGSASGSATPSGTASGKASSGGATAGPQAPASASATATPKGRALSQGLVNADEPSAKGSASPSASSSGSLAASGTASPSPGATPLPSAAPSAAAPQLSATGAPVDQPLKWMDDPGQQWAKKFVGFTCPPKGKAAPPVQDIKDKPLITCDRAGIKYLLSSSVIEGTQLTNASAGIPQNAVQWAVDLTFDSTARQVFAGVTQQLVGTQKQFAIVLDGKVISAPTVNGVINNGQAQITGNFNQARAQSLANSLQYGALPLKFSVPVVTDVGPTLASNQLTAGLAAGGIGLLLVLIYCMLYYRGLGIVVLASLAVAGIVTYGMVLVMSQAVNFTLTLPGIAGLIVAVGITADSFIVYFERIRDEMREGRSMRVAVEAGWVRARATCLAADAVSLLAAVVLYIFAIDVVRGFAFALGLSTLIDIAVFFLFTKPMVTWLASFRFFNTGHRLSGLSPDHVGVSRSARVAGPSLSGGKA